VGACPAGRASITVPSARDELNVCGSWLKAPKSVADTCDMGYAFLAAPRKGDAQRPQTSTIREERQGDRCDRTTASMVTAEWGAMR
jgi:hypothetical protein